MPEKLLRPIDVTFTMEQARQLQEAYRQANDAAGYYATQLQLTRNEVNELRRLVTQLTTKRNELNAKVSRLELQAKRLQNDIAEAKRVQRFETLEDQLYQAHDLVHEKVVNALDFAFNAVESWYEES